MRNGRGSPKGGGCGRRMCPLPREARKLLGVRDTDCLTPEAVCGHVHLILRLRHAMRVNCTRHVV